MRKQCELCGVVRLYNDMFNTHGPVPGCISTACVSCAVVIEQACEPVHNVDARAGLYKQLRKQNKYRMKRAANRLRFGDDWWR